MSFELRGHSIRGEEDVAIVIRIMEENGFHVARFWREDGGVLTFQIKVPQSRW